MLVEPTRVRSPRPLRSLLVLAALLLLVALPALAGLATAPGPATGVPGSPIASIATATGDSNHTALPVLVPPLTAQLVTPVPTAQLIPTRTPAGVVATLQVQMWVAAQAGSLRLRVWPPGEPSVDVPVTIEDRLVFASLQVTPLALMGGVVLRIEGLGDPAETPAEIFVPPPEGSIDLACPRPYAAVSGDALIVRGELGGPWAILDGRLIGPGGATIATASGAATLFVSARLGDFSPRLVAQASRVFRLAFALPPDRPSGLAWLWLEAEKVSETPPPTKAVPIKLAPPSLGPQAQDGERGGCEAG